MGENENQVVELFKAGTNVLGQFYQDLAQPSVKAIGQALATVFELCPNSLLSLRLWTEKRKLNFAKRLNEYKEKLEQVPDDKRCEVDPQIGTPIVEKLTYTTNDEIADLFTTLLTNASSIDTVNRAHPAFVDIISRLSEDEARIIKHIKDENYIPFCEIRGKKGETIKIIESHLTLIQYEISLQFPSNIGAYLSNLTSLGIIELNHDILIQINTTEYETMCDKYGIENLKKGLIPDHFDDIFARRFFYSLTPFGKLFINACLK